MNMLIIGNGFDLAHDRPTSYADFLRFLSNILCAKGHLGTKAEFEPRLPKDCPTVRDYILSSFDTRKNPRSNSVGNTNNAVQEIYNCLDKNVWYEYFSGIWREGSINGKNWIGFEQEILEVIDFFDHGIKNIHSPISDNVETETDADRDMNKLNRFWRLFRTKIQQEEVKKCLWFDFVDKTYRDLQDLVRCLEIYLDDCVGKMPIVRYSPDIQELKIDSVLSFNYTTIPTDIYPSLNTHTHCIHGRAKSDRPAEENDMVLGVNEYWEGNDKNTHTNFNLYKKFVQRIMKRTGIDYKKALNRMVHDYGVVKTSYERVNQQPPNCNNVYIFGHSLDITDRDILMEVIQTPGVVTTIFYRNKQQQANQIANLSKVLGQDELLERTFSTSPTIIFKQQADMKKL